MNKSDVYYFRLSSEGQQNRLTIERYIRTAQEIGFQSSQIYYEIASGGNDDRKVYQQILNGVKAGKIKRVFVPELTRFSRSVKGFELAMLTLKEAGAELWSSRGKQYLMDTPEQMEKIRLDIRYAQLEREKNQQQAINSHKYLRDNGYALKSVYPYIRVDNQLQPNFEIPKLLRNLKSESASKIDIQKQGKNSLIEAKQPTVWSIARDIVDTFLRLKVVSYVSVYILDKYGDNAHLPRHQQFPITASGIRQFLQSQTIRGHLQFLKGKKVCRDCHTPLISASEGKQISRILNVNKKGYRPASGIKNLWQQQLFCAECGSSCRVQTRNDSRRGYVFCRLAMPTNKIELYRQQKKLPGVECSQTSSFGLSPLLLEQYSIEVLISFSKQAREIGFKEVERVEPEDVRQLREEIELLRIKVESDSMYLTVLQLKEAALVNRLAEVNELLGGDLNATREDFLAVGDCDWSKLTQLEKADNFKRYFKRIDVAFGVPVFSLRDEIIVDEINPVQNGSGNVWYLSDVSDVYNFCLKNYQQRDITYITADEILDNDGNFIDYSEEYVQKLSCNYCVRV